MKLNRSPIRIALLLGAALLSAVVLYGCSKQDRITSPVDVGVTSGVGNANLVGIQALKATMAVQDRYTSKLLATDGVVGTATGVDAAGRPVIMVLTEHKLAPGRLPLKLDGYDVLEEVTGKIVAVKGGGGGVSHTAIQTPPIQLGTSGGPALDLANGYCCGGTLGSLVSKGGQQSILSNSHVFAGAIAQVRSGMVRTDGAILEIGTISSQTQAAALNMAVKKSGRTTGLTRSSISGLNATVNVGYSNECAGGSFTKTFTGQILISNKGSRFLNSGDSGSLMVQDITTNPRAVGLLFAGSSSVAVANPIGDVLSHHGATMVGQ